MTTPKDRKELDDYKRAVQGLNEILATATARADAAEEQLHAAFIDLQDLRLEVTGLVDTINEKFDKWVAEAKQVLEGNKGGPSNN